MPVRIGDPFVKHKIFVPNDEADAWREVANAYHCLDGENWVQFYRNRYPPGLLEAYVENSELVLIFDFNVIGNPDLGISLFMPWIYDEKWNEDIIGSDRYTYTLGAGNIVDNIITYPITGVFNDNFIFLNYDAEVGNLNGDSGDPDDKVQSFSNIFVENLQTDEWTPDELYDEGAIWGDYFDNLDPTGMFVDFAGTVPVENDGDRVHLLKSKNEFFTLGNDQFAYGGFYSSTHGLYFDYGTWLQQTLDVGKHIAGTSPFTFMTRQYANGSGNNQMMNAGFSVYGENYTLSTNGVHAIGGVLANGNATVRMVKGTMANTFNTNTIATQGQKFTSGGRWVGGSNTTAQLLYDPQALDLAVRSVTATNTVPVIPTIKRIVIAQPNPLAQAVISTNSVAPKRSIIIAKYLTPSETVRAYDWCRV